jgi:beta-lactamase class A
MEGKINSASVYMKKCGNIEWFAVNPDESFYTASLMKVAVLITILKMSENNPGYLDKIYPYKSVDPGILPQTYGEKTIEPGHDYTMRDLLYYMIVYSDNYASDILNSEMDLDVYKKLFTDIGIEGYNPYDQFRKLKAEDVGKLFRLLYNASYLSKENSEYALSLLAQSSFKDGLVKELPDNVVVAHKFAEAGGSEENQLHDAGIVYAGKTPYLLVVMTRGKKLTDLSESIGDISKKVYDYMNQKVAN